MADTYAYAIIFYPRSPLIIVGAHTILKLWVSTFSYANAPEKGTKKGGT